MALASIVFTIALAYVGLMCLFLAYVKVLHRSLSARQSRRNSDYISSPRYVALNQDLQLTFNTYVIAKMNSAQRKQIAFEVFRAGFLIVSGMAPIFAILSSNGDVQKALNAISSISSLFLAVLCIEQFSVEHRRAGVMIEGLIVEWLSRTGRFAQLQDDDSFRVLVSSTKEILDSSETSFIGAGPGVPSDRTIPYAPASERQPNPIPLIRNIAPPELSLEEVGEMFEEDPEITQVGTVAIAPKDFAEWQARSLAGAEPEITQGGF